MVGTLGWRCGVVCMAIWFAACPTANAQIDVEKFASDPPLFLQTARAALKWDAPAPPAKLIGPIYFVGTRGLSVYLIKSGEGLIVVNTGMPGSGRMIEESIRKLGFNPQEIKLLLAGHAHCDHVGGHAYLKKISGASIAMIAEENELFESGGKLDFHYGTYKEFEFEPAKVDRVLHDGEVITLGDVSITALLTPGHTKGSTTFTMQVVDGGKMYLVVFPNGTSINPGYRVAVSPSYAGIGDDYRRTLRVLDGLKADVWLAAHNEAFDYEGKLARSAKVGAVAWVDADGYRAWVATQRAGLEKEVAKETTAKNVADDAVPVNVQNFVRAETDLYFAKMGAQGVGVIAGPREFTPIDKQDVVRMNRDTLYSSGLFDLDAAPVTIELPDAGKRFMSMQIINQDHYTAEVVYAPTRRTYTKEQIGSRYMLAIVRTLADPQDEKDVAAANALRDRIKVDQAKRGKWESPHWDSASQKKVRDALAVLGSTGGLTDRTFGAKDEVDPVMHLIGTAIGWGGNPSYAAMYSSIYPKQNDGKTAYTLTVKDVPVDGFWSISVYNAEGYFAKNEWGAYSLNNLTAKANADGSFTIHFGGSKDAANYLPIMPGWNYTVRMYRPRKEIRSGAWKFPEAQAAR